MRLFALLMVGLFAQVALASQVFVEPATGSGVGEGDLDTTTQLVKNAVPSVSSNVVVDSPDQADYSLRPNLMKLGKAYVMGLEKVNKDGSTVNSAQLKAQTMDELDTVASRLTRAVMSGTSPNARVGEITNQEAKNGTQRLPTRSEWYVGAGGSSFNNLNADGIGYSIGIGHAWDFNTGLFKLMGSLDGLDGAVHTDVGLGGEYFLLPTDFAPYLSADFGFGAAKAEGNSGFFSGTWYGGFEVGVGAGVEIMHTVATHLDIQFRSGFLLKNNGFGTPEIFTLRLGLYF